MKSLPVIQDLMTEFDFKSLADFVAPIYFDNNATTKVDDDALDLMLKVLECDYGNPSGAHEFGRIARMHVESSREKVAKFIGCSCNEIVFTSGGTESINIMFNSVVKTHYPRKKIISCVTEHGATLNKLKSLADNWAPRYDIFYLGVDYNGNFALEELEKILQINPHTNLIVSLMAANNETGTIHTNIYDAISLAHKYGALFHVDAVQVAGKLPLKPYIDAGVEFLTISGHKFHAPKGIGVLYVKDGTMFTPTFYGGYHENGYRAGTENVPGIVAMGVVAEKMQTFSDKVIQLHQRFIDKLKIELPCCVINGGGVPGTINVGFKYVHREAMVVKLSQNGLYASVGSACAKGIEPSHVLKAMNVPSEYIHGSVRFSFSKYTTENEVDRAVEIIVHSYNELRKISKGIIS